ncbi:TolB family protein [Sandaracinus amylolyticus]|uniref:TolB family protein n=1 Tax=Sandaracinus amylolyticus TaxID=927083 RepID=UPI001F4002BE|nr:hypothetical protein [Sandaracinus amylolyticus]UJR85824.1 Hypothetical protein I5071_79040 [Sandaracinus amylolyticus]
MTRRGPRTEGWSSAACALGMLAGCVLPQDDVAPSDDRPTAASAPSDLPVLEVLVVESRDDALSFRRLDPATFDAIRARGAGLSEAALVDIPSVACTSANCPTGELVAFSNVTGAYRAITNGGPVGTATPWTDADAPDCGPVPPSGTGVCRQVRLRNLHPDQLERVYAELIELEPSGATTSVSVPVQPWGAEADFGLTPAIPNGLWRFGELGRSSPPPPGVAGLSWWAFEGTTPPGEAFTFRFLVMVRGQVVRPTQRANVAAPDQPASDYPVVASGPSIATSSVDVSADGRYVVFATSSTTIGGAGSPAERSNVVRHDMLTGANVVVNVGIEASSNCRATNPSISDDGTRVAFEAQRCRLVARAGHNNQRSYVFVRNLAASTTTLASAATNGQYANGSSTAPRISGDGSTVVFQSIATDLVTGTRSGCNRVYRYAMATGAITHVSATRGTTIDATAGFPACSAITPAGEDPDVSDDGSIIAFRSDVALTTSDTNGEPDVYVYRHGGTSADVYRVSVSTTDGPVFGGDFDHAAVSGDGAFVAFSSIATELLGTSTGRHVYRRGSGPADAATLERVTLRPDGSIPSGTGFATPWPTLSQSGRFVSFWNSFTDVTNPALSFPGTQLVVCDMGGPTTPEELARCFVISRVQLTPSATFTALSGTVHGGARRGLACDDESEACYTVYQANGTGWGNLAASTPQVFVSPLGDPRDQMPAPSP